MMTGVAGASNAERWITSETAQNGQRRAFHLPPRVLAHGRSRSNDRMRTRGGKGRGDRARAGSTDRSRSATKKIWMDCIHRVLLARVAPGSRLTPAKEDEAGRRGSDAASIPLLPPPPSPPLDRSTVVSQYRESYRFVPSTLAIPYSPFSTSDARNTCQQDKATNGRTARVNQMKHDVMSPGFRRQSILIPLVLKSSLDIATRAVSRFAI